MNVNNISVGEIFKNYKHLCETLNDKAKTGNAKKSQLKEWECYFDYEKQGHKFVIKEVFNKPKQKEDLRSNGNNASIYIEDIEKLILDLLGQERNKGQLFLSRNRLLRELKMINENYTYYRNKKIDLSKFMEIDLEEIKDFYVSSNSTFKSNLETALNRLQKQSLIYWNYAMTVCFIDTHVKTTVTGEVKATKHTYKNEKGETVTTYDTVKPVKELSYRKATKDEIRLIMEIERDLLTKYKCNDKNELYRQGKIDEYYKNVQDLLFNQTNIIFYYNSYEVLFNDRHIHERLEEIKLGEMEREVSQTFLNAGVMDKILDNANNRHIKVRLKVEKNPFDITEKEEMRFPKTYLINNEKLTDTLIDKSTKLIELDTDEENLSN